MDKLKVFLLFIIIIIIISVVVYFLVLDPEPSPTPSGSGGGGGGGGGGSPSPSGSGGQDPPSPSPEGEGEGDFVTCAAWTNLEMGEEFSPAECPVDKIYLPDTDLATKEVHPRLGIESIKNVCCTDNKCADSWQGGDGVTDGDTGKYCKNLGGCTPDVSLGTYSCDCAGTGYSGERCDIEEPCPCPPKSPTAAAVCGGGTGPGADNVECGSDGEAAAQALRVYRAQLHCGLGCNIGPETYVNRGGPWQYEYTCPGTISDVATRVSVRAGGGC